MWLKFEAICNNHVLFRSLVAVMHIHVEEMGALGNVVLQKAYKALRLAFEILCIMRVH